MCLHMTVFHKASLLLLFVANCGTPRNGIGTVMVDSLLSISYPGTFTYRCITGFETNETLIISCGADGVFNTDPPRCHRKQLIAHHLHNSSLEILAIYGAGNVYECTPYARKSE